MPVRRQRLAARLRVLVVCARVCVLRRDPPCRGSRDSLPRAGVKTASPLFRHRHATPRDSSEFNFLRLIARRRLTTGQWNSEPVAMVVVIPGSSPCWLLALGSVQQQLGCGLASGSSPSSLWFVWTPMQVSRDTHTLNPNNEGPFSRECSRFIALDRSGARGGSLPPCVSSAGLARAAHGEPWSAGDDGVGDSIGNQYQCLNALVHRR